MPRDSPRPNRDQPDPNVPNRDRPNQAHPASPPPPALPISPDDEAFFALPPSNFRQTFANTVGEDEAAQLFERHVVPAPRRLMADLGFGAVPDDTHRAHGAHGAHIQRITVDTVTAARGPLLLISGQEDRMIPDAVTRAAYKAYGDSAAVTDLKQFADRGHTLVVDSGWRTVADHVLAWLAANGIEPVDSPA
jgi:non-heme chloroperoxidase